MPTRNTVKTSDALANEILRIDQQLADLRERADALKQRGVQRNELMKFVKQNNVDRADILWVYHQLPALRISKAARMKRIAEREVAKAAEKKPKRVKVHPVHSAYLPFGNALKKAREGFDLTRQELGRRANVHGSMVGFWERGSYLPAPDRMKVLEGVLGTKLLQHVPQERQAAYA